MNVQKQIAKLESLLVRIQGNAGKERPVRGTTQITSATSSSSIAFEDSPHSALPPTARVDTGAWPTPAPAPIAAAPSIRAVEAASPPTAELEEIDMMDAEIVELGGESAAAANTAAHAPSLEADLDSLGDEPAPKSAPRPAAQSFAEEADLEPPVKTPPPESGRQIMAPVPAPAVTYREEPEEADLGGGSDVDDLLQTDMSGGPISKAPPGVPTMEQLGETVELEGADGPPARLELVETNDDAREAPLDDLELALPKQEFSGGYHAELAPPLGAAADLERHQNEQPPRSTAPVSLSSPGSIPASLPTRAAAAPLIVERPPSETMHVAEVLVGEPLKLPATFLELLDGSLSLKPNH